MNSNAFVSLWDCLEHTGIDKHDRTTQWSISSAIIATADFKRTIVLPQEKKDCMRDFLRPVRWILVDSAGTTAILISPHEANELLPDIRSSPHARLYLYSPRVSRAARTLERLDFFPVINTEGDPFPEEAVHFLNLFAGQLFFDSYAKYKRVRTLVKDRFGPNACANFHELFGYRRKNQGYMLSHMGRLLRGKVRHLNRRIP